MAKKLGLALGSGGARGLVHVGVIKTLVKHNIPIDYITGSSIGACFGAHYALYKDLDKLEEFALGNKMDKLISFLEISFGGGLIKGQKVEKNFASWFDGAEFKDLQIPFQAAVTDLLAGETVFLKSGLLSTAVRASSSIPGIFVPVKIDKKVFVDGGVSCPVPVEQVKKMGADVVLGVNLYNIKNDGEIDGEKITLKQTAWRSALIGLNTLAEHSLQNADVVINPLVNKYADIKKYFAKNYDKEAIEIGEKEAEKIIPILKKKLGI